MPNQIRNIRTVLEDQRRTRAGDPNMEILWQDFLELTKEEQMEMLFISIYQTTQTCVHLARMLKVS